MAIDGKYECSAKTPIGMLEYVLDMTTEGGVISGTMTMDGKVEELTGTVDGENIVVKVKVATPMGEFPGTATGKIVDGELEGVLKIPIGKMKISGKRVS